MRHNYLMDLVVAITAGLILYELLGSRKSSSAGASMVVTGGPTPVNPSTLSQAQLGTGLFEDQSGLVSSAEDQLQTAVGAYSQ